VADDAHNQSVADLAYAGGPHLRGNVSASRAAAHSSDNRELVAPVAERVDLVVGEVLPCGKEAPQHGTYAGVSVPDLVFDPRLGRGPLDIRMEEREKIIEPVGAVGV